MDVVFDWIAQYGYLALFALLMLGIVGLPVPDETLLTFAGYLIFKGELALMPTAAAAVLGSICGITLSYGLGRGFGPYLVDHIGPVAGIQPHDLDRMRGWYVRWGKYTLVVGYFVPGLRHLAALAAGSSTLPLAVFAPFAYTGGLLWSMTFLALGYGLGEEWAQMSPTIHHWLSFAAGIVLVGLVIFLAVQKKRSG
jgi:membrane protein DedA with SNARE-associated domain